MADPYAWIPLPESSFKPYGVLHNYAPQISCAPVSYPRPQTANTVRPQALNNIYAPQHPIQQNPRNKAPRPNNKARRQSAPKPHKKNSNAPPVPYNNPNQGLYPMHGYEYPPFMHPGYDVYGYGPQYPPMQGYGSDFSYAHYQPPFRHHTPHGGHGRYPPPFHAHQTFERKCKTCNVSIKNEAEWNNHLGSKAHKKKEEEEKAGLAGSLEVKWNCLICDVKATSDSAWEIHLKSKNHCGHELTAAKKGIILLPTIQTELVEKTANEYLNAPVEHRVMEQANEGENLVAIQTTSEITPEIQKTASTQEMAQIIQVRPIVEITPAQETTPETTLTETTVKKMTTKIIKKFNIVLMPFGNNKSSVKCDICEAELNGPKSVKEHLNGAKHKRKVANITTFGKRWDRSEGNVRTADGKVMKPRRNRKFRDATKTIRIQTEGKVDIKNLIHSGVIESLIDDHEQA